jgi:ParB family chromosome partitioning protein
MRKLDWIERHLPEGLVVDASWLSRHGYSTSLRSHYVAAGWLEQPARRVQKLATWTPDSDSRQALFAHCVSLSVNAVYEAYNRRPRALAHAGRLAEAVALDMAAAGWKPTVESYLDRVTKGRILDAVREAKGEDAAQRMAHMKKAEMATAAEALLAGTGWVPEPLRTPGQPFTPRDEAAAEQAADEPSRAVAAE